MIQVLGQYKIKVLSVGNKSSKLKFGQIIFFEFYPQLRWQTFCIIQNFTKNALAIGTDGSIISGSNWFLLIP